MNNRSIYFNLEELVCKHVFDKYGDTAWSWLDPRLTDTIEWIREKLGRPMIGNNYHNGGEITQRGIRCNQCGLVRHATLKDIIYMSAHIRGQAFDFIVPGMLAEEVRLFIVSKKLYLPYKIRMEKSVSWIHLDVCNDSNEKIIFFNP